MGISNYYFKNIEGVLVKDDYWDFHLSSDNQGQCLDYATKCQDSCSSNFDIVTDKLVVWFDTNNTGSTVDGSSIKSLVEWENYEIKPSSGFTLCDFGLTGVDNGRYDMLSGITVTITSADTKVILYPVTGYTIQEVTVTACTSAITTVISGITATTCVAYSSNTEYITSKGKYDYPWTFRTGTTTSEGCLVGDTICLNGGFYQGYFKLDFLEPTPERIEEENDICPGTTTTKIVEGDPDAMKYDLMPTEFEDGWTMETWIKWDNSYCDGCSIITGTTSGSSATTATTVCLSANTLNNTYTGNTGFFFYIGTRAENKFRNVFSGETGLYTCHGIPLSPDDNIEIDDGGQSWFTRSNLGLPSCWCPCPTGSTVVTGVTSGNTTGTTTQPYCDQLSENALGFRVTPDGKIGYRKMTVQVGCYNNKDRITGTTMEEGYSDGPVFFTGDTWNHVAVTYTAGSGIKNTLPSGTLKFWVNGRVVYHSTHQELLVEVL